MGSDKNPRAWCEELAWFYARELGANMAHAAELDRLKHELTQADSMHDSHLWQQTTAALALLAEALRQEHWYYLGCDPEQGQPPRFREHEAWQGTHLEVYLGRPVERIDTRNETLHGDFRDPVTGDMYDGVGGTSHFDYNHFIYQIERHVLNDGVTYTFVDISQFTEIEQMRVRAFIDDVLPKRLAQRRQRMRSILIVYP